MPRPLIEVNKLQPTSAMAATAAQRREFSLMCAFFYLRASPAHNKTKRLSRQLFSSVCVCIIFISMASLRRHALHYCNIVPLSENCGAAVTENIVVSRLYNLAPRERGRLYEISYMHYVSWLRGMPHDSGCITLCPELL